ncbi:MAG: AAA family ATPase, partial [Acidobacteriota bacterium]
SGIPYYAISNMIRKASRIRSRDDAATIREKLAASLRGIGPSSEKNLPFLLRVLGVRQGTEALDDLEPQAIHNRTLLAMRQMLLEASRKSLVVVEIEDLQWIDASSAEFLDGLIDSMAASPILVLLTYRSGYQPKWLDKSYATQLNMGRLSDEESIELVTTLFKRADHGDLPPPTEIIEKAEGNPFFLEEMAVALVDNAGEASVPDTVQGMLMARIDRLPEEHKQLLRTGSVLGRELALDVLGELWERGQDLEPLLDDLQSWELLYRDQSGDGTVYSFRQAMTQEVAYQSLVESQRQQLHGRAAAALERIYAGHLEDAFDRLIYHYPKSGQPEKTVHYLTIFARDAADGYNHQEAAEALREALGQAELLPEEVKERRAVEILLQLAESLLPLASFPETLEAFQGYLPRLEALDDPELAGPYYFWLSHTFTYIGRSEETRAYAAKSIEAAQEAGDETTEGKASYVLGRDGFWSGHFREGIENSLRAVVLLERNGEPWWQGQAYWVAGFNHFVLGQFEEAIDSLERARALGEALDDYRLDTSWSLGYFHSSLGEAETGIKLCQQALDGAQDPLNTALSTGFLGHSKFHKGEDLDAAIEDLESANRVMGEAGMQQIEGWFSSILAEALLARGDVDGARDSARRGLDASEESHFRYGVGLAQAALGRVELEGGEAAAARDALDAAKRLFEELEVPFEIARLDLDLGRLLQSTGDEAE